MISPGFCFLFEYQWWPADSFLLWEVQDLDYLASDWNHDPNSLGILPLISMLPGFNFQVFHPVSLLFLLLGKHLFQTHLVMSMFENVSPGSHQKNLYHVILKCPHVHAHWAPVRYLLSSTASGCGFNCTFKELKFNWETQVQINLLVPDSPVQSPKVILAETESWAPGAHCPTPLF